MEIIGIRAAPTKIFYSIISVEGDTFSTTQQELIIPLSFDIPQKLKYIRKTLLDIFNEYNIVKAGIRVTEHNATPHEFRLKLEGIIQELIASSKVDAYFTGVKSSIGSRLGISNNGDITEVMEGRISFKDIPDWATLSTEYRECIMVAFATLNQN